MKENSIERDITRVKQRIEDVKEYIEYGLPYSEYLDLENSFDNILSDYKRALKENEELKNDYENLSNSVVVKNHCIKNSIPVQTVKDKIRYYQELQDNYIKKYDEINEGLQAMINVLQELLEGRKI